MMKTLNKLATIALLIGTGQTFAGDSLSANLHTTEPGNLQASAMEIMSADELSVVRGGTFFAPLTPNQVVIAITGFAAQAAGGANNIRFQTNSSFSGAGGSHVVTCNAPWIRLDGTILAPGQISAGNYANHRLSAADVGLSFGLGVGMPFMSKGCTNSQFAIKNQVMLSETTAAAIIDRKQFKISQIKTPQEGQLLTQRWRNEDTWFRWGVTQAEAARDNALYAMNALSEALGEQTRICFEPSSDAAAAKVCHDIYQGSVSAASLKVNNYINDFQKYATEAGKAAAQHAKTMGLRYEKTLFEKPTYSMSSTKVQ